MSVDDIRLAAREAEAALARLRNAAAGSLWPDEIRHVEAALDVARRLSR